MKCVQSILAVVAVLAILSSTGHGAFVARGSHHQRPKPNEEVAPMIPKSQDAQAPIPGGSRGGAEEQPDRLVSVYNYIKQLVNGVTGQSDLDADVYHKIRNHVKETYAVQEPNELEDEELSERRLCETRSNWVLLNRTVNAHGDDVEIVHDVYRQWYHYTECVNRDQPCSEAIGEDFESSCVQTEAFQLMYARSLTKGGKASFMYVLVPRDCICKAAPRKKIL